MPFVSRNHLQIHPSAYLYSGNYTGILGWSVVELTLGVLAASLPTLAFLLPFSARTDESFTNNNSSDHTNETQTKSFPSFAPNPNVSSAVARVPRGEDFSRGHSKIHKSIGNESWLDIDDEADTIGIMNSHSPEDIEMNRRQSSEISSEDRYGASLQEQQSHGGFSLHGTPTYVDSNEIGRAVSFDRHRD